MELDAAKFKAAYHTQHEIVVNTPFEKSKAIVSDVHEHEHSSHTPEEEIDVTYKEHTHKTTEVDAKKNQETVEKEIPGSEAKISSTGILKQFEKIKKIIFPVLLSAILFQEIGFPVAAAHEHHIVNAHSQQTLDKEHGSIQNNHGNASVQEKWNIADSNRFR